MLEKRKTPRFDIPIKIEYSRVSSDKKSLLSCSKDISMRGVRITAEEKFSSDDILDLAFYLPNRPVQEALGKVMWQSEDKAGFDTGIRFLNIRDSLKEDIFDYLNKYFPSKLQEKWWAKAKSV